MLEQSNKEKTMKVYKYKSLGTLFFNIKSSKGDAVDLAILLKNDKIIFLVKKFMVNTTRVAHTIIRPEVIRLERLLFMP